MPKREFVQLAHKYDRKKCRIAGWFMSEKLDGFRCIWDGGITRGLDCREVPWANTEKHGRYVNAPRATGLWTRYGQPIQAPGWFLEQLPPKLFLDGELYAGRGNFQLVSSVTRQLIPDARWELIRYYVFDLPSPRKFAADGEINVTHFKKRIVGGVDFVISRGVVDHAPSFQSAVNLMKEYVITTKNVQVHEQRQLPFTTDAAHQEMDSYLEEVCSQEGEGVMLRNGIMSWIPERSHNILKHKPYHDDEGVVVGYTFGRETDKGSKLLGLMGALILSYKGKIFELSGFTDEERLLSGIHEGITAFRYGILNPGARAPSWVSSVYFPIGSTVTFKYRELTDDLVPKEARYWRK